MAVSWKNTRKTSPLFAADLELGESFKIVGGRSRGAVYQLVKFGRYQGRITNNGQNLSEAIPEYQMLEWATGKLYDVTDSPVERVSVNVTIEADKPSIY